jgi:hypothetical protein
VSNSVASAPASGDAGDSGNADSSDDSSADPAPSSAAAAQRYVAQVAGVRLGEADTSVIKIFGSGLFTNQEGTTGARYYVDAARTLTLYVGIGKDSAVDSLELSHGIALPAGLTIHDDPRVTSRALDGGASASKGITLGMSAAQVEKRLGKPTSDERTGVQRVVSYDDEVDNSNYSAQFTFVGDQLRNVWISDSD